MENTYCSFSKELEVIEDLDLSSINLPKVPKNLTVPDEINDYLRIQLQEAKYENENIKKQMSDTQLKINDSQTLIEDLTSKLKEYEGQCKNGDYKSASQVANSKIIELSKKLREKSSEIEVYKTKCSRLEVALAQLKDISENVDKIGTVEQEEKPKDPDQLKKVQEKLNYTSSKWAEEKSANAKLKNDLKLANKWLQQEVGDKFETLLSLNNSNSNWRGRAQVICDLQKKNSELKEKLKSYQDKNRVPSETSQTKTDKKIEALTRENSELNNSANELQRKLDIAKARCRVLEKECGLLKTKMVAMNEQNQRDQEIITSLTSEMSCRKERKSDDLKQKDQQIKKLQQENELLKIEIAKEKCASENKSKELQEKNDDINVLNKRIRSSRPSTAYKHRPENTEAAKTLNRLEAERLKLLELTELQNRQLEEERNAHFKTQNALRVERQKGARLEANLARKELEDSSLRSTYSNRSQNLKPIETNLRDKLELAEENLKALSTRLEIEIMERKRDLQEFGKILRNY